MRHDRGGASGILISEFVDHRRHACGHVGDRLGYKFEIDGILQIGLEFARKEDREIVPSGPGPPCPESPFGGSMIDGWIGSGQLRDGVGCLHGAVERGRDDRIRPQVGESVGGCSRLLPAYRTEVEAVQIGVYDVIGIVDFAMSHQMQSMEHGVRVYRRRWSRPVAGYRRGMVRFLEHVAHLDMDAFFVEVERGRRPDLVGKAVLVGGAGNRGVVASASYEARGRGVRSGMPMVQARRLVPHGVVVPPDHSAYRKASDRVFEILGEFTPSIERVSVDEAFIDIGGLRLHYDSPHACVEKMRAAIRSELSLPSSVGIATTRLLAKMASRDAKPDGVLVIEAGTELRYLHPKPVGALWGVGQATRARIEELGIETVGDIVTFPRDTLVRRLGAAVGAMVWDIAHGADTGMAVDAVSARSISVEQTYETDLTTQDSMERELLAHADKLSSRLRRARYVASTITVKVRYPDFTTVSRSHTFAAPVSTSAEIFEVARRLLGRTAADRRGVRLLGVGGDGLVGADEPRQLALGDSAWEEIDEAVEKIRDRFGGEAVGRARLADFEVQDGGMSGPL